MELKDLTRKLKYSTKKRLLMYVFQGLQGYGLILGLMILEGIGLPVPSEVIMPYVGYSARIGGIDIILGIVIGSLGSLIGSIIDYFIGLKLGLPFLKKYGKVFGITEERLEKLNLWFKKYGDITVFSLRFVPEIRALISFPAGIAAMSFVRFLIFTFAGHMIWDSILAIAGYLLYEQINYVISLAEKSGIYIFGVFVVVAIGIIIVYLKRSGHSKRSAK